MPLPSLDKLRSSATGAVEMASGHLEKAKFKLMRTSEEEAQIEEESQTSETSSRLEEFTDSFCPKLTFQQRLIGFGVSFGIGYLITCMSFKFFIELVEGHPVPFALNYSFGNLLSLLSMTFLCGPKRQFKNMFDEKRKFTSITYLSCLVATVGCIFIPMPGFAKLLLLVCLILAQFCACMWYSLSYIPFGRRWALRCLKRQLGLDEIDFSLGSATSNSDG
ncbi:SFT2 domain containing [Seminavis robusta]|uniref:Vesicle transport protein n=1 Tax=Seminavis robusta TaxID=568900 RepID=A0A9N8EKV1_9STRA|nr:SFT2 domain containing [Seminavis robusta]|eukprot:Sro1358_g265860.1 SFT2 domain containing (220) ;mRNA; r:8130-8989